MSEDMCVDRFKVWHEIVPCLCHDALNLVVPKAYTVLRWDDSSLESFRRKCGHDTFRAGQRRSELEEALAQALRGSAVPATATARKLCPGRCYQSELRCGCSAGGSSSQKGVGRSC